MTGAGVKNLTRQQLAHQVRSLRERGRLLEALAVTRAWEAARKAEGRARGPRP